MSKTTDIFELLDKQFRQLPFHKRYQRLDEKLAGDTVGDALTDLTEEDANIEAIYYTLYEFYDRKMNTLKFLLDKRNSLMRSRDRLGRQEYLRGIIEGGRDINYVLVPRERAEEESQQQQQTKRSILSAIKGIFSRGRSRGGGART
ncbi:MAG: hypothetical protein DRJ64_09845 [Thermoprotei archaeon]|nr:MAG: hypothetical protein DRJ64_09845 [Thermoprotei archaeon]